MWPSKLTTGEGLREDLGGEGYPGARGALPLLHQVVSQHVPPAAVQEAVEDV